MCYFRARFTFWLHHDELIFSSNVHSLQLPRGCRLVGSATWWFVPVGLHRGSPQSWFSLSFALRRGGVFYTHARRMWICAGGTLCILSRRRMLILYSATAAVAHQAVSCAFIPLV